MRAVPDNRDYRLDFFRGLALIFIFLNHIPGNAFSWATNRNYGFSDATEIFVFISGYTAAIAYGRTMQRDGFRFGAARILSRTWEIYVAHIFLFVVLAAHVVWVAQNHQNIDFLEGMGVLAFLADPQQALVQTLLLSYRPVNMDVLPLYIALLLVFPMLLWSLMRWPLATLGASCLLWLAAGTTGLNLPGDPDGGWFFNPFAWQFLFALGAACSLYPSLHAGLPRHDRVLVPAALAVVGFGFYVTTGWNWPETVPALPMAMQAVLYPVSKTNLDVLRLVHFLAVLYLAVRLMPAGTPVLASSLARPVIVCGQHSLHIFCLGTVLSFTGHWILSEIDGSLAMQAAISLGGIAAMIATAQTMGWYAGWKRQRSRAKPAARKPAPSGATAGQAARA
jgi:hypothetical protein